MAQNKYNMPKLSHTFEMEAVQGPGQIPKQRSSFGNNVSSLQKKSPCEEMRTYTLSSRLFFHNIIKVQLKPKYNSNLQSKK